MVFKGTTNLNESLVFLSAVNTQRHRPYEILNFQLKFHRHLSLAPCVQMTNLRNLTGQHYPQLELRIAWNQPMFTHHGTYIIGFSLASKHVAMNPERATMIHFEPVMRERGTDFGKMFARQPWNKPFDFELLDAFIQHQLAEKQAVTSFWRPQS